MDRKIRRFECFTAAFIDYQIATSNFNEAVVDAYKVGKTTSESITALARNLAIKHTYFLECARRLVDDKAQFSAA